MKLLTLLLLLVLATSAQASQTWVALTGGSTAAVAPGGCASAQGASDPGTYYRTIKGALDCYGTAAGAGAGHTVIVKPGTYSDNLDEASIGQWLPRGSVGNPFTLKAQNRAVLRASDGTLSAGTSKSIIRRNGFLMRVCAGNTNGQNYYTTIDGFDFDLSTITSTDGGLSLSCSAAGANFVTMQYNDFHDSPHNMMMLTGNHSDTATDGNSLYFYYNRWHDGAFDQTGTGGPTLAYPVYIQGGYNGKFIGNEFWNFPAFGLHFNDQPCDSSDPNCHEPIGQHIDNWEIAGNYFHDWSTYNGGSGSPVAGGGAAAIVFFNSGLNQSGGTSGIVGIRTYNNIFKNGPDAIRLQGNAHLHKFNNNTLYNMSGNLASDSGSAVEIFADTIAKNNIFSNIAQPYLGGYHGYDFSFNATNMAFNFCTNAGAGCSATGNPLFNNTTNAAGFRLGSGSPAINAGTPLGAPYNVDAVGVARSGSWDMGAFQYSVPVTVTPQLVLALPLDAGSGRTAADVSGQNNTATIVGGAAWDNGGKYGKAIMFDGTGYLDIPYTPSLALAPAMTLEAWVYPTVAPSEQFFTVMHQGNYWLFSTSSSGACTTPTAPYGGYLGTSPNSMCATAVPPLNQWSHLALTYDGLNLTFYLNGNVTGIQPSTVPMIAATNNLTVGRSPNDSEFFIGRIDEVRVYNYSRTPDQVLSDMNTPLIGGPGKVVEIAAPASVEISSAASLEISAD